MRKLVGRLSGAQGLLSGTDFRRLCLSQVFGGLGEWLATLALIALVWERTHNALASGVILAFRILPAALIGSFLGSMVDRMDRRRVLVASTAGRAAVYGALPIVGGVAPILALALVAEVASLTYIAARDATLPRLVPTAKLPAANAISMASAYGGMPVGSGLFALFTVAFPGSARGGVEFSLVVAGVMLAVATMLIGRMQAVVQAAPKAAVAADGPVLSKREVRRAGRHALRALLREDRILRRVVIGGVVASAGGGAVMTLGLAYVRGTLRAGPAAYSGLLTAFCFGAAIGVAAVQRNRRSLPSVFRVGVGVMGAILLGMALFPSQAMGYGMGFVFGGAFVATFLGGVTILQERIHDGIRGRAFALAHSGLRVGAVAVGVLAAWGANRLGTRPHAVAGMSLDGNQIMLAGVGLLLFGAATLIIRVRVPARASAAR